MTLSSYMFANDNWTLVKENGNVKVYYEVVECTTGKMVILKVENSGAETQNIVMDVLVEVDGQTFIESGKMVLLNGEESIEGMCDHPNNQLNVSFPIAGEEVNVTINLN